ncbi:MAG: hypothetical protein KDF65_16130, partial [Anaerolineae bacterium]|nr:hypothetical protein [Anaerolineae bacterium]
MPCATPSAWPNRPPRTILSRPSPPGSKPTRPASKSIVNREHVLSPQQPQTSYLDPDRIVITGLGAVTPLGHTVAESWENLLAGRSGIDKVTLFDAAHLPVQIAGEVKAFDPQRYIPRKEARR